MLRTMDKLESEGSREAFRPVILQPESDLPVPHLLPSGTMVSAGFARGGLRSKGAAADSRIYRRQYRPADQRRVACRTGKLVSLLLRAGLQAVHGYHASRLPDTAARGEDQAAAFGHRHASVGNRACCGLCRSKPFCPTLSSACRNVAARLSLVESLVSALGSRCRLILLQGRKTDCEQGSPAVAGCRRDRSAVALHDGAADRESHAHSVSLCRMEGGKDIAGYLRINSGPRVLDLQDGHLRV